LKKKNNNLMKDTNAQNALFMICPFCNLENFLRTKFGNDIFFITAPAAILNFSDNELISVKEFMIRENIKNIYLVNDVSCNFIEEAISNKKEFGLRCEKELRMLVQNSNSIIERKNSLEIKKEMLAENNVTKQLMYLNSEKIFHETSILKIKIDGMITDKNKSNNFKIPNL
jgi:hypothetical protein